MSLLLSLPYLLVDLAPLPETVLFLLEMVLGLALDAWSIAAFVLITWSSMNPATDVVDSISGFLRNSVRLIVPMVLLLVVMQIAIGIGLFLLVVPGVVLFTVWIAAQPACALERRGISASLLRSQKLTEGVRMKVAWSALVILLLAVIPSVLAFLSGSLSVTAISFLAGVVLYPMSTIAMTVIYARLVNLDRPGSGSIA
ncbi:MAG: hypothetical protein KDB57_03570 [Solirubrobacterales bacterium]|nr:hypothetical protein [Solirubrobacterales bacterium]